MSDFKRRSLSASEDAAAFHPVWQSAGDGFRSFSQGMAGNGAVGGSVDAIDEMAELEEQIGDAYRKGFAEGQAAIAEANDTLIAASETLAKAAENLKAQPGDTLCATLVRAVQTLLERAAGFAVPDAVMLEKHCQALAAIARKDCTDAVLHIHPEDHLLLANTDLGLAVVEDASLMRGTLSLAHADGWIEQGTQPMLDELDAMIEAMEMPK